MTKPDNFCLIFQLFLAKCVPGTLNNLFLVLGKKIWFPWNTFFSLIRQFLAIFEVKIKPSYDQTFISGPDLMCPSSEALNSDDFPFFGSSIAHLEPELQRFEDQSILVGISANKY